MNIKIAKKIAKEDLEGLKVELGHCLNTGFGISAEQKEAIDYYEYIYTILDNISKYGHHLGLKQPVVRAETLFD